MSEEKPKQRRKRQSVGVPPKPRTGSDEMQKLAEESSQVIMKMQVELNRLREENEQLKKSKQEAPPSNFAKEFAKEIVKSSEDIDLYSLPLKSLEDYHYYNKIARKQKKPMKCAPDNLFPTMKVKFIRRDNQQGNPLKIRRRDAKELIDFKKTLLDNEIYELPVPIVNWLNSLGVKRYKEVKNAEGLPEMYFSHIDYRFSCQMVA